MEVLSGNFPGGIEELNVTLHSGQLKFESPEYVSRLLPAGPRRLAKLAMGDMPLQCEIKR
jgi:hypothetical protein